MIGQDLQTALGLGGLNAGVTGTSKNGVGVRAKSTHSDGVSATGVDGVVGSGTSRGVMGVGPEGTEGDDNGSVSSDAIFANGHGGNLFRGNNQSSIDVFVVDNGGNTTIGGNTSVGGTFSVTGEAGFSSLVTFQGDVTAEGVLFGDNAIFGEAHGTTSDNIVASSFNPSANLFRGNNSNGADVFMVDNSGNVFAHSFSATLALTHVQATSSGKSVHTYSQQAAQPSLEDFGEAQLASGGGYVRLDPAFASAIDRSAYLVMVTPEGDCRGLYVSSRTPQGFSVRELQGGRSTIAFSYRIVARPFGDASARLPLARVPSTFMQVRSKIDRAPVRIPPLALNRTSKPR